MAASILSKRSHNVPGKLRITEWLFQVPRDWNNPSGRSIQLFARSVRKAEKPADPTDAEKKAKSRLPWLLFLQGGPGFGCGPPQDLPWTSTVLDKGYELILLDQRGTGLSTPISASTLGLRGDDPAQAEYMKCFRGDSIVKDCEAVRKALTKEYPPENDRKWSIMGQSFGGFCCTTYLSFFPEGLREVFMFGGLPPLVNTPDEVYRRQYKRVIKRNEAYYEKFPEDIARVKSIVELLTRFGDTTVRLPSEGYLSARRFMQLGINFGAHGGIDIVHNLVLQAATDLDQFGHITRPTTMKIERTFPWDDHVIYCILHEPIYCQGNAANWSAERVKAEYEQDFTLKKKDGPLYFTGEMVYPFQLTDCAEIARMAKPAELLAQCDDWPALYDETQLAKNEVPVYCAVYMDDMYVDFDFSMETASKIKGCKTFVTNMMYHDAVRSRTQSVMRNLFSLRDDSID